MEPTISVIMGAFNDELFIGKAIESVLKQTYTDFEFIICNDCSTDSTGAIIESYQKKDDRIKYIINEHNLGLANSLNKCLKIAKGKYIARMDSDDISMHYRFEKQVNFLNNHQDFSVVGGSVIVIDNNGEKHGKLNYPEIIDFQMAVKKNRVAHPSVMMRSEAVFAVNGYTVNENTARAEDYDLWCKLLKNNYKLTNLNIPLLYYREDLKSYKKRKFKYRIQEFRLKKMWYQKANMPYHDYISLFKIFIAGIIPACIMNAYKYRRYS